MDKHPVIYHPAIPVEPARRGWIRVTLALTVTIITVVIVFLLAVAFWPSSPVGPREVFGKPDCCIPDGTHIPGVTRDGE